MTFKILVSPHALDDIEAAAHYYNEKVTGLGSRFAHQVQSTIEKIADNPFMYEVRYNGIRCAGVWKFPFLIHFTADREAGTVLILSVYSTYQNPKW
jgi:toxin ParE1/3/4